MGVGIAVGVTSTLAAVGVGKVGEKVAANPEAKTAFQALSGTIREVEIAEGVDVAPKNSV